MTWIKAVAKDELPEGARLVVEVGGQKLLLVHEAGAIYAMAPRCPHMGAPLKRGKIKEGAIVCPLHRSAFDMQTGDAVTWTPWPPLVGKLMGAVSGEHALAVFPTRIEDESIWVEVEEK